MTRWVLRTGSLYDLGNKEEDDLGPFASITENVTLPPEVHSTNFPFPDRPSSTLPTNRPPFGPTFGSLFSVSPLYSPTFSLRSVSPSCIGSRSVRPLVLVPVPTSLGHSSSCSPPPPPLSTNGPFLQSDPKRPCLGSLVPSPTDPVVVGSLRVYLFTSGLILSCSKRSLVFHSFPLPDVRWSFGSYWWLSGTLLSHRCGTV